MSFTYIDLNDIDETAKTIKKIDPDIIHNLAVESILPDFTSQLANYEITLPINAGFMPWTLFQLPLAKKLLLAIRKSACKPFTINTAFGDGTNPVLLKHLVKTVYLIKGNNDKVGPIKEWNRDKIHVELQHTDKGLENNSFYYVKVIQSNGEMGWAGPIWVNCEGASKKTSHCRKM